MNSKFFPVVVALRAWSKFIMGKLVFHYLDNDTARSTFIRAGASTSLGTTLVTDYVATQRADETLFFLLPKRS